MALTETLLFLWLTLLALPIFYIKFWYIAFIPLALGIGISLWKHNFRYAIRWILFSILLGYIGTLVTLFWCIECLIKISIP